ncbi:MAG: ABC transporter permease [Rhodocyclaceae bacterium]
MSPVVLWTDALIGLLLLVAAAAAWYGRRNRLLREAWRRVGQSRSGMAAAVVLACFVAVGLADSIHYRPKLEAAGAKGASAYSAEVESLLDRLAAGLRAHGEKTYSAPFATRLYAKETVERPDGSQVRDYPRLVHGGAHLKDEAARNADVAFRAAEGLAVAFLAWLAASVAVARRIARREGCGASAAWWRIWSGETAFAWNAVLASAGLVMLAAFPLAFLAGHYHVLGTDKVGQDVLLLSLKSVRTALVIGTLTTLVMLPFAVGLGILAGYAGGWIDDLIQYLYTTLNSIPGVLLIAASVLMMQVMIDTHPQWFATAAERSDARLLALCAILGVTSWTGLCRLLRGETLKLRELEYVEAARAFGVPAARIMLRHVLPNLMHLVMIAMVMDFSGLVLAEAVLSYVGIGVDPNTYSFGTMINAARLELSREPVVWWSLAAAFLFMLALVLSANLVADAVRDAFDPRLAGRVRRLSAA